MTTAQEIKDYISNLKKNYPTKAKIKWTPNPNIGWWRDLKTLTMFHGTHFSRADIVLREGLKAPISGPTAGWVSVAFDPNTAFGYASMSGEAAFRAAGGSARTIPTTERLVFVLKLPMSYVLKQYDPNLGGNMPEQRRNLTDKELYGKWPGRDSEYYMLSELRLKNIIPRSFVVGYMMK